MENFNVTYSLYPRKKTAIIQLIDEQHIHVSSVYLKLGMDKIWTSLIPHLQSEQIDTYLGTILKSFKEGTWQERLESLACLLIRVKLEHIVTIFDEICELFKKDIKLCKSTGMFERFFFNSAEKEKSRYKDYSKLLSVVVPYFNREQIRSIQLYLMEIVTLALLELPDLPIDDDPITKRKDQEKLLSYLKREQIREIFDKLLVKLTNNQSKIILMLGPDLLSTFLPKLEPDRIESLLIPVLQLADEEEDSLRSIGLRALTHLSAWCNARDIDKIYAFTALQLQKKLRIYSQVVGLLASLVRRFHREQIQTALNDFMLVIKNEEDSVRQIGCEGLFLLSPYLFDRGVEQLSGLIPALLKDSNPVVCQIACSIIKVVGPRLHDEQAQTILTELLAVMETREVKILAAGCGALVKLPSYLLRDRIELLHGFTLKILQISNSSVRRQGFEILGIIARQMQKEQIAEVLPEIQKLIAGTYASELKESYVESALLYEEMIIKTYSILTLFLPILDQKQILSLLPPLSRLSNRIDNKADQAIANFINCALTRIDYQLISQKAFLHNPLLILMKLMYQFSEQLTTKENSVCLNRAQPSFFSAQGRIQTQEIVPTSISERKIK